MERQHLLLPSSVSNSIVADGATWGAFGVKRVPGDELYVVAEYTVKDRIRRPATSTWLDNHCSSGASISHGVGFWYRADPELNAVWESFWRRRASMPTESFRERVKGWRQPGNATFVALTYADPTSGAPIWRAWALSKKTVTPITVELVPETADIYFGMVGAWPLDALAIELVSIIGLGSIGAAVAEGLSEYGIRRLALVDYDRLQFHNLARHRLTARDVGRFKVNAMRDFLLQRDPDSEVHALTLDVIAHANTIRSLFRQSSIVVVCSDGVASRRAANHLACWAATPLILACVLEDGGIGEVLRVKPGVTSCLACFRERLVKDGSVDPEPGLDRGYGTGSRHLPMTAVGGDLDLVGKLAAKAAVATLLERRGYLEQWLPHDHLVIGLRPPPSLPPPFNVKRAGDVKWTDTGKPLKGCPSCRAV